MTIPRCVVSVEDRLLLEHVLQACSLLLELVVVVLEHLDQFGVGLNLLVRIELNLCQVDSIVVRNGSHLSEGPILSGQVFHLALQGVDKLQMLSDACLLRISLLPEPFDTLHTLAHVSVSRVELQILGQPVDLVLEVLISLLRG